MRDTGIVENIILRCYYVEHIWSRTRLSYVTGDATCVARAAMYT